MAISQVAFSREYTSEDQNMTPILIGGKSCIPEIWKSRRSRLSFFSPKFDLETNFIAYDLLSRNCTHHGHV